MLELLKSMIKEEWRIHSTLFGNLTFSFFPIIILVSTFLASMFYPIFSDLIPPKQLVVFLHYIFLIFGMSVGAFGLLGREVMNRRFGQVSLVAYSSRSLPISEKRIFLNFLLKDLIYYFFLWILPFILGIGLALPLLNLNTNIAFLLLLTLTLSFLIGLSIIFLLSVIYIHSTEFLIFFLILTTIVLTTLSLVMDLNIVYLLPTIPLFETSSLEALSYSILLILIPTTIGLNFLKVDYPEERKRFRNSLDSLAKKLGFTRYSYFISKDFIDLKRSEGGAGKIIFSFLFPLALIWFLISLFFRFVPLANPYLLYALFLGVIGVSIYNWLTEYDLFTSYAFLPVRISTLMKSKIVGASLINLISLLILIFLTAATGNLNLFIPALLCMFSTFLYILSLTVYLTNLHPHIFLYNPKVFLIYLALSVPVLVTLILLHLLSPLALLLSPILIPFSIFIMKKGFERWDKWEHPSY